MKLKPEQTMYVASMSKLLKVTAIFDNDDEANAYMSNHGDEGVIAVFGSFVMLANLYDKGTKLAA